MTLFTSANIGDKVCSICRYISAYADTNQLHIGSSIREATMFGFYSYVKQQQTKRARVGITT